jgi:hypothetical protein
MKYLKILGLAAIAAMALMAFAGTASATVLNNGSGNLGKGALIKSSLEGSSVLSSGETTLNTCTGGQFTSEVSNPGGSAATVSGPNTTIDFENCASAVHTVLSGTLEIHHITGTTNGTVTASGVVIRNTIFGTSCDYESGTALHLGTLTGGKKATLHINVNVKESSPKFLCPDTANWTATFRVTSPETLNVEAF